MDLNPFMYSYKNYPNSKLATMLNGFLSGMQRIFILAAVGIVLVVIFDNVSNSGEALIGSVVMFALWLLIKLNKNKWSDKIAARQEKIDNQNNIQ